MMSECMSISEIEPAATDSYRRFGNFIGEAEESDAESQHAAPGVDAYVYDGEADEEEAEVNDQQLMEVDGTFPTLVRLTSTD